MALDETPLLINTLPTTTTNNNDEDNPSRPPTPVEDVPPTPPIDINNDKEPLVLPALDRERRRTTTTFSEAPLYLQQNEHILSGYRQELGSWSECVKSVAWVHNELANIHTHLLPSLFFLSLLSLLTTTLTLSALSPHQLNLPNLPFFLPFPNEALPTVTWLDTAVFACLFGGAAVCFGLSAAYHCGLAHSERVCARARRFDHFGILFHTSVRFIAAFHYGFHPDPHLRNIYIVLMLLACAGGVYVIVLSNDLQAYEYRRYRTGCFFAVGAVAAVPFGHAIIRYGYEAASERMAFSWIGVEVVCLLAGMIIYSERFPECFFPGRFDLIGNSHNLFHLLAVAAVFAQWKGAGRGFAVVHIAASGAVGGEGGKAAV